MSYQNAGAIHKAIQVFEGNTTGYAAGRSVWHNGEVWLWIAYGPTGSMSGAHADPFEAQANAQRAQEELSP